MNDKHREFNENDLLERISEGLDISESDYRAEGVSDNLTTEGR